MDGQPQPSPSTPAVPDSLAVSLVAAKAGDTQEITLPGDVKLKKVWCPPGTFTMGSPVFESGRQDDEEEVEVTLAEGFWLAQTETTQGQYTAVMETSPWVEHGDPKSYKAGANSPAVYIDHTDAKAYCAKLTEIEHQAGRLPTDWAYSLPTEAQWEYACRAGTKTKYSFGEDEAQLDEYAWFAKNTGNVGKNFAQSVATKTANPWGFCDMHGNTWEWCRDAYDAKLPGGRGPFNATSATPDQVLRGGSWYDTPAYCRSAYRLRRRSSRGYNYGFRIATLGIGQAVPDRSSP